MINKKIAVGRLRFAAALYAVMMATTLAGWAQAAQHPNRITQDLNTGGVMPLRGSVHRLVRQAIDLGQVDSSMQLSSMTMHFGVSAAQQADLEALLQAQQNPKSPLYHHWLTQEEYGARFGLTDTDLQQVTRWLGTQGFTVQGISTTRDAVTFTGKAWQVDSAFHTQLHRYELNGQLNFANATELQVPAALKGVVLVVRGLSTFKPKPQVRRPDYTVKLSDGTTANFLSPADWATIYNVNALYDAGFTGTSSYVGVVGQTYAPQTDIDHFRSAAGLGLTKLIYACTYPSVTSPNNTTCKAQSAISTVGDLGEADLDIEWSGGIAKNATVVYVYAPYSKTGTVDPNDTLVANFPMNYDVFDALYDAVANYRINGKVLPVISMSYTDCEEDVSGSTAYANWISQLGAKANAQGQTIVVATGDTGAAGCDSANETQATLGQSATVPVDSPSYTGVGGTTLSGDESDPLTYWNQTVGQVSTAKMFIPETVWNDTAATGTLTTTGSGVSAIFAKPSWQPTPSGFTGTPMRFIPDVAFAASAEHDGYLTCSSDPSAPPNDCSSGFANATSGGLLDIAGGTSAGAPSFAGMLTLLVQQYGPQGNINPMLYGMAADPATYSRVFHDTTSGNNIVPCKTGTTGCPNGTMGFTATSGYDLTTGLGSIDAGALMNAVAASGTTAATTTQLTVSPTSAQLGSTKVTLTAKVNSTTAGTINGQVTFTVNGTALGSATLSSGTATLSNVPVSSANGFTGGSNTISANYQGGDSFFAPSTGTASLAVSGGNTQPPLTVSPGVSTVSCPRGGSTAVMLNLSSSTYAGTVSFTVTSSSPGAVSGSAPQVVLTSGGSGSSTLTITASATAANHLPALPWKSGAIAFAALFALPSALRKKSRIAVLLLAMAILPVSLLTSCGSGSSSGSTTHSYTLTVTPTTSPTASPAPSAFRIIVNVQ